MKSKFKTKFLSVLVALMLVFSTATYAQAECTKYFSYRIEGVTLTYWCCTGSQGCFFDLY